MKKSIFTAILGAALMLCCTSCLSSLFSSTSSILSGDGYGYEQPQQQPQPQQQQQQQPGNNTYNTYNTYNSYSDYQQQLPTQQQQPTQQPTQQQQQRPTQPQTQTTGKRSTCSTCKGTGMVAKNQTVRNASSTKVYCSICKKEYKQSTGHSHIACTKCNGTGYTDK